MKNIIYVFLIIILGTCANSLAQVTRSTTFDDREICEKEGGVWRQFGNGCVGNCKAKLDRFLMCTMALTYGCDCGKDRCFNDSKCVKISEFKTIFDQEQEVEKEAQEAQKEARKDVYRNVRNNILNNLNKIKDAESEKQNNANGTSDSTKTESNNNLAQFRNSNNNKTGSSPIVDVLTKPVFEKSNENPSLDSVTEVKQKFQIPSFFLKNKNNDAKKVDDNSVKVDQKDSVDSPDKAGNTGEALPKIPLPN